MASQFLTHTVGDGDTIQSIGMLYGVNWTEIVTLNGLEYPYICTDIDNNEYQNNDSVAKIGSTLVLPTNGITIPIKTNNSKDELEKYTFGSDLDLFTFEAGDSRVTNLEIEGQLTDDTGDIKLSEGIENLRQQLIVRIGTPKGALLLHPDFGTHVLDYIGRKTTVELLIKLKLEIQECVLGDFRVLGVSDFNIVFKDHGIFVEFTVHPVEPYSIFRVSHLFTK